LLNGGSTFKPPEESITHVQKQLKATGIWSEWMPKGWNRKVVVADSIR
jgi:hypothetical protein